MTLTGEPTITTSTTTRTKRAFVLYASVPELHAGRNPRDESDVCAGHGVGGRSGRGGATSRVPYARLLNCLVTTNTRSAYTTSIKSCARASLLRSAGERVAAAVGFRFSTSTRCPRVERAGGRGKSHTPGHVHRVDFSKSVFDPSSLPRLLISFRENVRKCVRSFDVPENHPVHT